MPAEIRLQSYWQIQKKFLSDTVKKLAQYGVAYLNNISACDCVPLRISSLEYVSFHFRSILARLPELRSNTGILRLIESRSLESFLVQTFLRRKVYATDSWSSMKIIGIGILSLFQIEYFRGIEFPIRQ